METQEAQHERERRTRWSFACHADNLWYWQAKRADGNLERSEVRLETLADCLTDAMQHGYVAWNTAAERRGESPAELVDE
jgi:hypothetical protein